MKTDTLPVTVVFNQVEEFIAELEKDSGKVERGIVRRATLLEGMELSPNIHHVSVFSAYSVKGQLITLKHYCGDIWGLEQGRDKEVIAKVEGYHKAIEETCKRLGLEVRPGAIKEGKCQ